MVVCIALLALTYAPQDSRGTPNAATARARTPQGARATLSHYGDGDGFMGKRTKCGKTVRKRSLFVAALKPQLAHCNMHLTLTYRGHRYHVAVQDSGTYRRDTSALDAAPGLRRVMHFRGLAHIRYSKGWH